MKEELYKHLFDTMNEGVAIYEAVDDGEDFVFIDYNKSGQTMEGVSRDEVVGKRVTEVFPGVKKCGLLDVFQRVWKTGEPERHPVSLYQDATLTSSRANYVYKLPLEGKLVAVYSDETKQQQALNALRESDGRYRLLAENVTDAVWTMDLNLRLTFVSPSVLRIQGYTAEEAMHHSLDEMMIPESVDEVRRLFAGKMQLLELGDDAAWEPIEFEAEQLCKNGSTISTRNHVKLVREVDGRPSAIVGVYQRHLQTQAGGK